MRRYFLDDDEEAYWTVERQAIKAAIKRAIALSRNVYVKRWYKPGVTLSPVISLVGTAEYRIARVVFVRCTVAQQPIITRRKK